MGTARQPGTLILLRHGQSTWNLENLFTGWHDVPLSERGVSEAIDAGRLIKEAGLAPDVVHTSLLVRAIETADLALGELERTWIPVRRSWRLNERHYGALQGLNKAQTAERYGVDKVKVWRRSYDVRPPDLEPSDERHPSHDPRYASLPPELLPSAECLKDVVERMLPYWYDAIVPDLLEHSCVLVSAHGNSLSPGQTPRQPVGAAGRRAGHSDRRSACLRAERGFQAGVLALPRGPGRDRGAGGRRAGAGGPGTSFLLD